MLRLVRVMSGAAPICGDEQTAYPVKWEARLEFRSKYINTTWDIVTFSNGVQLYPMAMILEGAIIGSGTRIQSFSIIEPGAIIGRDCTIRARSTIIGSVWLGKNVFVGSGVEFIDRRHPRNNHPEDPIAETFVHDNVVLGVNSTIFPVSIGEGAVIGAASLVLKNVPPGKVVRGIWNR